MTIDPDRLARDTAALVEVPSVTGDERAALERLAELAAALGLGAELRAPRPRGAPRPRRAIRARRRRGPSCGA